ncbi:hypothetical protein TNCV_3129101 [Trichonephila clavipes]|nr:hypothetical protein TNCV_3129101 [Trichonephila clavipes]
MNSDDCSQELPSSSNQELTIDELIEMHEHEQDIEKLESLEPVQLEDRMTFGNLIKCLSLIKNGLQILENIDSNDKRNKKTYQCSRNNKTLLMINLEERVSEYYLDQLESCWLSEDGIDDENSDDEYRDADVT